ncbi:MAG: hypothetical protein ACRENG_11980 [bacterium]
MSIVSKDTIKNLILVPALITLAITLLRLTGELMNWSPVLFNKSAGGGGALIGIAWLVPIFGFYFARQLMKENDHPAGIGRVFGFSFLGIAVYAGLFAAALQLSPTNVWILSAIGVAAATAGLFIIRKAWPSLFSTLFAYGLAARIPVIIVMFIAIMNNWGTHYDVPPPDFPETGLFAKWIVIGLIPQLTFWMVFTVAIGSIFGGIAVAVAKRSPALAKAAS